jgi:DICT domain-containing protein
VYRRLATETDLDVHVYGAADWNPPEIAGITYHGLGDDALERYWVLAFDGGTDETRACGLVAREEPGGYDGFWTDDPEVVRTILAELAGE